MKAFDMLPAGHDDRLPSIIDALPPADPLEETGPVEDTGFASPRLPRSRIFVQGRIIGHLLPMIRQQWRGTKGDHRRGKATSPPVRACV